MVAAALTQHGFCVFPYDSDVCAWAFAAKKAGLQVLENGGERRHGETWFVGVDVLPNAPDGSVDGVPLSGAWRDHVDAPEVWHKAQLSVVFSGYPKRDQGESKAAHSFRKKRDAAHVDGLLPEGPARRRHLREPHGFILGLPLDDTPASPLVVWAGSHRVIRAAFETHLHSYAPAKWGELDVTDIYQAARRRVFETCERIEVVAMPGQAVLLDRHLVHGVAPWEASLPGKMRMIAYFRPQVSNAAWLSL